MSNAPTGGGGPLTAGRDGQRVLRARQELLEGGRELVRDLGGEGVAGAGKHPQLAAREQRREARDALAHVGAVIAVAPTQQRRLADLRGHAEQGTADLVGGHVEIHAHESGTHHFVVVRERVLQRLVAAPPILAVPVFRLHLHDRPEHGVAADESDHARRERLRLPGAAGRPRRESLEAVRVAMTEAQHEVAAEAPARQVGPTDPELVEQGRADVLVELERVLDVGLLREAAARVVEHDDTVPPRE